MCYKLLCTFNQTKTLRSTHAAKTAKTGFKVSLRLILTHYIPCNAQAPYGRHLLKCLTQSPSRVSSLWGEVQVESRISFQNSFLLQVGFLKLYEGQAILHIHTFLIQSPSKVLGCIHTCLVWFNWIELKFVFPLGADLLGRCEYSNRSQVRTKQPYWDPAEEVVSVRFQANSGTVEWMNQWMDDLSTHVVLFTISGSLAKRAVWKWTIPRRDPPTWL